MNSGARCALGAASALKSEAGFYLSNAGIVGLIGCQNAEPGRACGSDVCVGRPQPGEQATYILPVGPNSTTGYATIAYVSNPSQTGNVIILAGTDSDATGAAADFLTSEEQMEKLRETLHVSSFPYFEVLLKTSRLSGAFFSSTLIAYRTYPGVQ
jgi:hypothetical protein